MLNWQNEHEVMATEQLRTNWGHVMSPCSYFPSIFFITFSLSPCIHMTLFSWPLLCVTSEQIRNKKYKGVLWLLHEMNYGLLTYFTFKPAKVLRLLEIFNALPPTGSPASQTGNHCSLKHCRWTDCCSLLLQNIVTQRSKPLWLLLVFCCE